MINRITSCKPENTSQNQRLDVAPHLRNKKAAAPVPEVQDAVNAVKRLIADVLEQMRRSRSVPQMERLSLVLVRLWGLVYPTY